MLTSHYQTTSVTGWFSQFFGTHDIKTIYDTPAHWSSVKIALIKSIRNGVFFDRKYWARYSKAGDFLKPLYFSSIIMDDKAQQLNNGESEFGCWRNDGLRSPSGKIPQGPKHYRE